MAVPMLSDLVGLKSEQRKSNLRGNENTRCQEPNVSSFVIKISSILVKSLISVLNMLEFR